MKNKKGNIDRESSPHYMTYGFICGLYNNHSHPFSTCNVIAITTSGSPINTTGGSPLATVTSRGACRRHAILITPH